MVKILVIEDEEEIRELVSELLTINDFEVIQGRNGEEGIQLAFSSQPDLIICDIMMPEMDGYTVLKHLQQHLHTDAIPFIFLTAKATRANVRQGMNLGADDYLTKPFRGEELLQTISTRLKKRSHHNFNGNSNYLEPTKNELHCSLYYNCLTGLPNQLCLRDKFEKVMSHQQSCGQLIAITSLSIDRFNYLEASLGYDKTDFLLKEIANRLIACSTGDTIAHLNRDEFAIISIPIEQKEAAAAKAQTIIDKFSQPFLFQGQEIFVTLSMGIACYPQDGQKLEQLLPNAKKAMAKVKDLGGNMYQFYIPSPQGNLRDCIALETALRYALKREELELYYQPQVDSKTRKIMGAEALLRWHHPEKGFVSPAQFIPLAEETGQMELIGEWVLRRACEQIQIWQDTLGGLSISVNISGRQFNFKYKLDEFLTKLLRETRVKPKNLELELTESILVENIPNSLAKLHNFKALGLNLALDDFGTGYSSLSYLQQFPFDILKIERCFVQNIDRNQKNAAIVQATIIMAHELGLRTVAEGVETEGELDFLCQCNCDLIQGYLFSPPMPAWKFETLVKAIN